MEVKRINQHVSVSPQISPEDIPTIKAAGFTTIVNNRPDGEAPDQPTSDTIRKAAQAAGLVYHHIPLGRDGVSPDMIERTTEALEGSEFAQLCAEVQSGSCDYASADLRAVELALRAWKPA